MPSPIALATKEEEERRAWVTAHHEVVRLVKDCFGDRFSNNEIFDRLKISRRTGYRALGNDERIGKAPGRKPKIMENTIRDMIDYIENGGCNDVGNVWKHLAEKFAPDCNPKTVQDAVKKSGFKNFRNTVKLEPLLAEHLDYHDEDHGHDEHTIPRDTSLVQQAHPSERLLDSQSAPEAEQAHQVRQEQNRQAQQAHQSVQPSPQQNVIDPAFSLASLPDLLQTAIGSAPDDHIRFALYQICNRYQEAAQVASSLLYPFATPNHNSSMTSGNASHLHSLPQGQQTAVAAPSGGKHRPRLAICRRCNQQFDRAENSMEKRSCLYHKGSPQKISPDSIGTIEETPEAYIWSCCGGNGMVRGCCRAMHTTKKKRKYGKKRTADEANLDGDGDEDDTGLDEETMIGNDATEMEDPNIDASLQNLQPADLSSIQNQLSMQMAVQAQLAAPPISMHEMDGQERVMPTGLQEALQGSMQSSGPLAPEMQMQLVGLGHSMAM